MKQLRFAIMLLCISTSLFASADSGTDFRNSRYDALKGLPPVPGQIVFAGNSITNMHSWLDAFGSHADVVNRGCGAGQSYEILNCLENYIDAKPAKFFLMIGTNDISTGSTVELTARRIKAIVKRVRIESPETEVYVQSILPRYTVAKPDYEQCNDVVREWVETLGDPKVTFVNLSEVCAGVGKALDNEWTHDGLHLRPVGYSAWTHYIEDMVGYPSVYPEHITTQNSCGLGGNPAVRAEQFPFFPVSEGDVLFFGDSHVTLGEWHELLRSEKMKNRGIQWNWGGIYLPNAKQVVSAALRDQAVKPAKVLLSYGIGGQDQTNYRLLVDEAIAQVTAEKVCLVSLPPSADAAADASRVSFNAFVRSVATEKGVTFIDIYTPLKENIDANIMGTNYISGRGYVVVANELAKYLDGVAPVSLEEYETYYAHRTVRKIIGDALTEAYTIPYGDYPGQISESVRSEVESHIPALVEALDDPDLTEEKARAAVAGINAAIALAKQSVNMPKASTDGHEYWYTLTSSRGTVSTLTATGGKLVGGVSPAAGESDGSNIWKFLPLADGSCHIVNAVGEYISPAAAHGTQMTVSAQAPEQGGWTIDLSEVQNAFVLYTSNCQINQTDKSGLPVYNWYSPNYASATPPNRTDAGCAYYIALYGENDVESGDTPVGIGEILSVALTSSDEVYDLQGRRVATLSRGGLYIVNGKKLLINCPE